MSFIQILDNQEMNKCRIENCSSDQLITDYKHSLFCASHTCTFNNCEKNTWNHFITCKSHTCETCMQPFDNLEDNGLILCMRCYKKYIRRQQLIWITFIFLFFCANYAFGKFIGTR